MTGLPTKTVVCTPIRDAWVLNAELARILRNSFQRPWPGCPHKKSSRTLLLLLGNAFQRLWQGGPPRKGSRTRLLLLGNAFQRLWPGGPHRKGSRTRMLLPGNAFQRLWPGGLPGEAAEQDCYYQEMPSRGSGQGVPQERLQNKIVITRKCLPEALARGSPMKGSRTRSFLP